MRQIKKIGAKKFDNSEMIILAYSLEYRDVLKRCHFPFRDSGNEASIRVPRMFNSHV
jgi:hypothetical protein